jgi:hypothetical protein
MLVKFIKKHHLGQVNDIKEVSESLFKYLKTIKVVEEHIDNKENFQTKEEKVVVKTKKKKDVSA